LSDDKEPPNNDNEYDYNNDYDCDDGGHNNTDGRNNGYNNGYNSGHDDGYDNNGYSDYDNDYYNYEDDGFYNDDGYHSHSLHNDSYNTTGIKKIVEKFEHDLQLLWDTFLSLYTKHNFLGHRLDHVVCTTTSPQPFKLVGSTSPRGVQYTSLGRVHCGNLHLHKVLGLPLTPPTVSRYNQPRLRLHIGLRLGPWAPSFHMKPSSICGTRHQP